MATECTKENKNIYFRCRKAAAAHNDKLGSRAGAAELLGISESSLADYELGNTKVIPVDKVVLMADLYNAPELKAMYCKNECPIGGCLQLSTSARGIEGITLRLLRGLNSDEIKGITDDLISVTADGVITQDEKPVLQGILNKLDELTEVISELKIASEKALSQI